MFGFWTGLQCKHIGFVFNIFAGQGRNQQIAKNTGAKIISNFEITSWVTEKFNISNCHPMNHGGSWKFDFGKVKYVNAVHSSVLPDGTYGGNIVDEFAQPSFYLAFLLQ